MQWSVWLGEGLEPWILICALGQGWMAVERHGKIWHKGSSSVLGILGHSLSPPGSGGDMRGFLEPVDTWALLQKGPQPCSQSSAALGSPSILVWGWSLTQLAEPGLLRGHVCLFVQRMCVRVCVCM